VDVHRIRTLFPLVVALVVAAAVLGVPSAARAEGANSTALHSAAADEKCVGLADPGSIADGTHLVLWDCHYHPDQLWHGVFGSGLVVSTAAGNKCVGLDNGGSTVNGTLLVLAPCGGGHPDQLWEFYPLGENTYMMRNYPSHKCAGLANRGSTLNGTELVLWDCHLHPDQRWRFPVSPREFELRTPTVGRV
jgi:hypothetical protein